MQGVAPPGFGPASLLLPAWLNHVAASFFLHQDLVLVYGQQQRLLEKGITATNYHRHIYSPNGQDTGVYLFKVSTGVCFLILWYTIKRTVCSSSSSLCKCKASLKHHFVNAYSSAVLTSAELFFAHEQ
jgi:Pheophorbide a oxygenase